MRSECLGTTPWTGSLVGVLRLQLSPVAPLGPEFHGAAPTRQNAPGPVGRPGLAPLTAERTEERKAQRGEKQEVGGKGMMSQT